MAKKKPRGTNTESEIMLAINQVLDDYETEIISSSSQMTRIKVVGKDRAAIRDEVHKELKKINCDFVFSDQFYEVGKWISSFPGTILLSKEGTKTELVYKAKGGDKQSGGGAAITKLTESAQCVYAAVRQNKGSDIVPSDVNAASVKAASNFFDIDEKVENVLKNLTEDWIISCTRGANVLVPFFGKGYSYHRGSKTVNQIEKTFKDIKAKEKVRMDINKWSPADIYAFKNFDPKCLNEEMSFKGLNQCMQERIQKGIAMGVSLKKIEGNAKPLKKVNFDKNQKNTQEFSKFEFSKDSMDGYIYFKSGVKIQFRSFGGKKLTGWQGEVKGASANQGKISLGPMNILLKQHGLGSKQIPTTAAKKVRDSKSEVIDDIKEGFKKYTSHSTKVVNDIVMKAEDPWLYSKWQVVKLFDIVSGITNKTSKDKFCEDLLLYAASQSSLSAPYYKLTD